jgi:hypothetical protein
MTLDFEVNEVEVKVLTSLASVTETTAWAEGFRLRYMRTRSGLGKKPPEA